ncbi:hypothetical protein QS957_22950, partial [Escherichia coli]|nr:hypothetical protein [Escherichia coli]
TGGTADRNRSHWSTSKTPSYTKSVSWQHHPPTLLNDEKRKWLTEYTTRQNTTMSLRRVTLRPGLAGNLITGQILPVSLFNTSLLPW